MWIYIFIIFIFACFTLYIYLCRHYLPPANKLVPTHPGKMPIIGHLHLFFKLEEFYRFVTSLGQFSLNNGGVSQFFIGPIPVYVITDPDDVSTVLNKCLDKMFVYKFIQPMFGKMLIAAEVSTWKHNRRILDLGFKQNLLDAYLDLFNNQAERLVQALAKEVGAEVDLTKILTKSVLETSCRTTLGTSVDGTDLVTEKYVEAVNELLEITTTRVLNPWLMVDFIFDQSSYKLRWQEALKTFVGLSEHMVRLRKSEHLERLKSNKEFDFKDRQFQSVLDILIENSVTETKSIFTEDELRDLVDNVFVAAFDTTIYEMLLALVCIVTYPHVQDRIYQEIMQVLGEHGKPSKDNLSQLIYLEAVIKESVRLYPIAPLIGRQASMETKLRSATVPAGSSVVVHVWAVNRHRTYWGTDADHFTPERWLSAPRCPTHHAAYASFGPGRRGCIGKAYALMYMKATLVHILRKFRLTSDHTKISFDCKIMIKPKSGHLVTLQNRI